MSGWFEEADLNEHVGFKKIERYKGSTQRKDIIRIYPVTLVEGEPPKLIVKNTIFTGKRENGTAWVVNAHPDPAQNYAAQLGYEPQTSLACLVIVLAFAAPQGQSWTWDLSVKPWTFGDDKRRQFQKFKDMGLDLSKQEFLIRCEKEDFQKLDITVIAQAQQYLPQVPPDLLPQLKENLAAAIAEYRKFLKPATRVEQERMISGNSGPQAPQVGAGYAPNAGGFPVAPPAVRPAVPPSTGGDPLAGLIGQGAAPGAPQRIAAAPSLVSSNVAPAGPVASAPVLDLSSQPVIEAAPEPAVEVSKIVTNLLDQSGS